MPDCSVSSLAASPRSPPRSPTPAHTHGHSYSRAEHIDLDVAWAPLAWLTTTAVREAWRLNALEWQGTPRSPNKLAAIITSRAYTAPDTAELAAMHERLGLVDEIPERPRRFLLRLALGYSYDAIATAEGASRTTTSKQIARAKRRLHALDTA